MQAYGAKRYAAMGIIAQRTALICLLLTALIIAAWTRLEQLLLLLGDSHRFSLQDCHDGQFSAWTSWGYRCGYSIIQSSCQRPQEWSLHLCKSVKSLCLSRFAGQDPGVSAAAARYIRLSSPALVLITISDVLRCVLTARLDIVPCTGMHTL